MWEISNLKLRNKKRFMCMSIWRTYHHLLRKTYLYKMSLLEPKDNLTLDNLPKENNQDLFKIIMERSFNSMEYVEYISFFHIHQNFVPLNFRSGTSYIFEENQVNWMTVPFVCPFGQLSPLLRAFFESVVFNLLA